MSSAMRWRILQLADSAFPTGGFAHSGGLEAAFRLGEITGGEALARYLRQHLGNVGRASLPFVAGAYDDPGRVGEVDALADALLLNHVANRASRTQGRAFLSTCARVFDAGALRPLVDKARARAIHAHLGPMFGATLAAIGVERRETLGLYLYFALRGSVSAAVRLGAIAGPLEAQSLQAGLTTALDDVLEQCERLGLDEAATVAPVLDVMAQVHDRLYSRLFQS
jgi:urease accessory protein